MVIIIFYGRLLTRVVFGDRMRVQLGMFYVNIPTRLITLFLSGVICFFTKNKHIKTNYVNDNTVKN